MTGQQEPQAASELIMVCSGQAIQDLALRCHQFSQRGVNRLPAGVGQLDKDAAPIIRVILPDDKASPGEPVNPIGHRSRGDERFPEQLTRRQPVRRARATQRGQNVELPRLQTMSVEGISPEPIQVASQPANPGQHLHRRNIDVWTLAPPRLHDGVDLVTSLVAGHNRSLDVKTLDVEIHAGRD